MADIVDMFRFLATVIGGVVIAFAAIILVIGIGFGVFEWVSHASWQAYYARKKKLEAKRAVLSQGDRP